eukprot:CAMPEP_0197233264 /NCGR_PEP_ID=MMETSP1429-20130617/1374_1 /TAXON_ID=49237 /ORGANISM="Chaetoceros  sp., Strain UNC1202" /LENGTH=86 /DNA_ID=CAMNT_0042691481 /DNA_START=86 /DNA_END=346 /DNA_ORIENTATION=-
MVVSDAIEVRTVKDSSIYNSIESDGVSNETTSSSNVGHTNGDFSGGSGGASVTIERQLSQTLIPGHHLVKVELIGEEAQYETIDCF